jgi:hypothetical protein
MEDRFRALGLDRRFEGIEGLVRATQEHQLEALRYQIAELRRHGSISGYVITELSDIYWEANGLLDLARRPKALHDRLAGFNAPTVVVGDLRTRDWVEGERIRVPVTVSAWDGLDTAGGTVAWEVVVTGGPDGPSGHIEFEGWPAWTARVIGELEAELPAVEAASRAALRLVLRDREGLARATADVPFAILSRRIAGVDVAALAASSGVAITDLLDRETLDRVRAGARVVVVAAGPASLADGLDLPVPLRVHHRASAHPDQPAAGAVWDGDWITTFAWAASRELGPLAEGRCLDLAFQRVLPDHGIVGDRAELDPATVTAGLFAGWVHAPAAISISMQLGAGRLIVTTFRLDPGNGPIARALLAGLVRQAAEPRVSENATGAGPAP